MTDPTKMPSVTVNMSMTNTSDSQSHHDPFERKLDEMLTALCLQQSVYVCKRTRLIRQRVFNAREN
jgi:hypothetical protein